MPEEAVPICPLCGDREGTLEHFLYECTELLQDRKEVAEQTGMILPRTKAAEVFIVEADYQESLLIHRLYAARVEKEVNMGPKSRPHSKPILPCYVQMILPILILASGGKVAWSVSY